MAIVINTAAAQLVSLLLVFVITKCDGQSSQIPFEIRFCVPEDNMEYCLQMANNLPGSITCVQARDKFECMNMISRDQADILNVEPEDLYLAGRIYNLEPFAMEELDGNLYKYRAGVLIPKTMDIASLSDLRGKRTCHTGVGKTAGWNVPIGQLLATNTMVPDCRSELNTVASFFGGSCAPGRWSADSFVDQELKKQHPSLCSLCKDPVACSTSDEYAGYEGAIKCLLDGQGQVAFTTVEAVDKYFRESRQETNRLADDYQFLCLDGTRMPVTRRACDWSRRPSNAFVIRKGKVRQKEVYLRFLQQVFFRYRAYKPSWFTRTFVSSTNVTNVVAIAYSQQNWESYLGNYIPSIEKPQPGCERKNVTFCTSSYVELAKCLDMQKVAYSRRVRPDVRCVNPGDSKEACIEAIRAGRADVISLDAGDLYAASRYKGLTPIAAERTNQSESVAYYAVAVIRVPSEYMSLAELQGARSCHTGFGRTEGWTAPIGALIEQDVLPREECNRAAAAANFFTGSCVPGAADYRFNPNVTGADVLCKICAGDETGGHSCERGHSERFEGEAGAFRCLAEGKGDVAFVNHYTPFLFTDGRSREFWARGLRADDFKLLCKTGGQAGINEFERCNIAKVPTNYLAVSETIDAEARQDVLTVLADLSDTFTRKAPTSFKMFGAYQNISNLVFSDISTGIVSLAPESTYREALGDFLPILQDMDQHYCENGIESSRFSWMAVTLSLLASLFVTRNFN